MTGEGGLVEVQATLSARRSRARTCDELLALAERRDRALRDAQEQAIAADRHRGSRAQRSAS